MRIRSRLLILLFSILVPALIGAVLGIYYVYVQQQDSYRESVQELTNAMAQLLDREISERLNTLQTLAASPALTDHNLPTFYRYSKEVASTWDTAIILADADGNQLFNTRVPYGEGTLPGVHPSVLALRKRIGPDAPLISGVYHARIAGQYSFSVQLPVMRDGRVLYYVQMSSVASELQKLFERQSMPRGWTATILDGQGVAAARSREPEQFVGKVADAALRARIMANRTGTNEGINFEGTPVTAFFSKSQGTDWSFVISVPREQLVGPARNAAAMVVAIALLLLSGGTAVAIAIARKTAQSMEILRLSAADLGRGRVIARQASGIAEVDAVSMELARAGENIRSAQAQLEHRVADAVAAAERSQKALVQSQKLEALGRLTGGIAHDFNNIMQTLTTGLQLLFMAVSEPRLRHTVEACERAVERAAELTRQLMAFGRVQEAHLAVVDLGKRINDIMPLLQGGVRGDISLRLDAVAASCTVAIDPTQFDLAMLNVVINARDAMPSGGCITIGLANVMLQDAVGELAPGDYVTVTVTDTGEGMRQDVLSKALDPFFTTKPVGKGSGMGLAQAYGFAKQGGGGLTLESTVGVGTTVTFYLPRATGEAEPRPSGPTSVPIPQGLRGKILFVEDDPLVAAVVGPALKEAGFDVHHAKDGAEALEMIEHAGPFSVVFSDIVMPGPTNGVELARHVVRHAPGTKVVLATGYSEQHAHLEGVEILAKPYDVRKAIEVLAGA